MSTITQFPSGNTRYRIEFDYLARTFVVVTLVNSSNPALNRVLEVGRDYRFLSPTMIEMLVDQSGFDIVRIHRQTGTDLVVDFRNGSVLTASDLTNSELQAIHIAEEGRDQTVDLAKEYADAAGSSAGNAKDSEDEARRIAADIKAAGRFGYITRRSFEKGFNVTTWNEALLWEASGEYYRWDGEFPKIVPAGSTPDSTGEVKLGAWVSVGDASLAARLIDYSVGNGDEMIAVKQPYLGASNRTQHAKNKDVINVKDFGAIGDGNDHPLSEIFSTLTVAQMVYPFVTSLSQTQDYAGIQSAINAAKTINAGVFAPSGQYITNTTITADYAVSMYGEGGQGLRDVESTHGPSHVRGTVIMSKVASGRTLSIAPDNYCFGLTLRDFAIWGVEGQCDVGLYLTKVGWMGIVSGVNIQHFPNHGLEIGYIQDTYFNNCSVLQCGNFTKAAVYCHLKSNYVYFNGCHFELTAYMLDIDTCWFWSWHQCHFEVARPVGDGITDSDRFYYSTACMRLGSSFNLSFTACTFIPVDVAHLATKLSIGRDAVPYFMTGSGSWISFGECIWLAPEGSVDIGYFTGSHIKMSVCQGVDLSPSRPALYIARGAVEGCTFAPKVDEDTTRLYGITVMDGAYTGNFIGFRGEQGTTKRTSGFLFTGAAACVGNEYPNSVIVNKYLDNTATVYGFDGKTPTYVNITATGDVDLTDYHPSTQLRVDADSVTITHIYGAPWGRDVIVSTNKPGTVIKFSSNNLLTQGALDFSLGQYHTALFKCLNVGIPVLQQIG